MLFTNKAAQEDLAYELISHLFGFEVSLLNYFTIKFYNIDTNLADINNIFCLLMINCIITNYSIFYKIIYILYIY